MRTHTICKDKGWAVGGVTEMDKAQLPPAQVKLQERSAGTEGMCVQGHTEVVGERQALFDQVPTKALNQSFWKVEEGVQRGRHRQNLIGGHGSRSSVW